MSFTSEYWQRIINEQNTYQDLIHKSSATYEVERAIEKTNQLKKLYEETVFTSNIATAVAAARSAISSCLEPDYIRKITDGQSVLVALEQANKIVEEQRGLVDRALRPFDLAGITATGVSKTLQNAMDSVSKFYEANSYDHLSHLSYQDINRYVDPVYAQITEITTFLDGLENDDEEDTQNQKNISPEQIAAWLLVLERGLKCAYEMTAIFLISFAQGLDTTLYIEIEGKATIFFERHQAVAEKIDHIVSNQFYTAITTTDVHLRSGPSTSNDKLTTLPPRTHFLVTGENGEWASGFASLED
ncbi:hypothetical protein HNQ57_003572, partial [Zhongshania antarctica]